MSASADQVERHILAWLDSFVVGLNLCPFARPLVGADTLRIAVCAETSAPRLRRALLAELDLLQASSEGDIATTLLVFPLALPDFDDYLQFFHEAQALLDEAGLTGVLQLASFHPHYRFEGEDEAGASHYSNRSPYPLIHLLREDMLTRLLATAVDPAGIPTRNINTLCAIGAPELARRWRALLLT